MDTHTHTCTRAHTYTRTHTYSPPILLPDAAGGDVFHSNGNLIPKNSVAVSFTEFAPADELPVQAHCFAPGPKEVNTRWMDLSLPDVNAAFLSIGGDVNTSTISVTNPTAYFGGQYACYADRQFIANFYLFSTTRTGECVCVLHVCVHAWVCNVSSGPLKLFTCVLQSAHSYSLYNIYSTSIMYSDVIGGYPMQFAQT